MKRLSFNKGTLIIDENQVRFEIPQKSTLINSIDEMEPIFQLSDIAIDCTGEFIAEEEKWVLQFSSSMNLIPFERIRVDSSTKVKLQVAESLMSIGEFFDTQEALNTVFHPINILVHPKGEAKILYRGIHGLMPASGYDQDPILEQSKRLILPLFTSARYDELRLNGLSYVNQRLRDEFRRIAKRIYHATDWEEMRKAIEMEREELQAEESASEVVSTTDQQPKTGKSKGAPILSTPIPLPVIVIGVILLVVGAYFYGLSASSSAKSPSQPQEVTTGLQLAAIQKYEEAAKQFAKVDYKQLAKEDQKAVLFAYLLSGQAQKALQLEPKFAETVVSYYVTIDNRGALMDLETQSPSILFEKAWIEEDFDTIIKLKDQVKMDDRRQKMVIHSFVKKNQADQALQFAQETKKPELLEYANSLQAK